MDELTQERFGTAIPWRELHARPNPVRPAPPPARTLSRRRIDLCGTDDLKVTDPEGARLLREARLIDAIRRSA